MSLLDGESREVLTLTLIFLYLIACTHQKAVKLTPAWRDEISQRASEYAQHVALPFLVKEISYLNIPQLSGFIKTPLGNVDYSLKKIKLDNVNIPKANISLQSSHGLKMAASDASLNVRADWSYREQAWPHISDSGACDVSITGVRVGMSLAVKGDIPQHKGTVHVNNCNLNVKNLKVKFKGGASWLYNLFSGEIAKELKQSLEEKVCKAATKIIDSKANNALHALPRLLKDLNGDK